MIGSGGDSYQCYNWYLILLLVVKFLLIRQSCSLANAWQQQRALRHCKGGIWWSKTYIVIHCNYTLWYEDNNFCLVSQLFLLSSHWLAGNCGNGEATRSADDRCWGGFLIQSDHSLIGFLSTIYQVIHPFEKSPHSSAFKQPTPRKPCSLVCQRKWGQQRVLLRWSCWKRCFG